MPQSVKPWDAVVVGGGLSGSAAAAQLAKKGKNVLLLEKEAAAHDKVCGEFLSVEAQHYLRALGLDLEKLGAVPVSFLRMIRGPKLVSAKLPFCALSLSRKVLDEAVLAEAVKNGAQVERNAEVTGIAQQSQGWRITTANDDAIEAPTLFLATGKHDLRGWRRQGGIQNDFIGFKMHFRLSDAQKDILDRHIELILFDGGYAGLEPIEDGKANLCLVVTKKCFSAYGKKWNALLDVLCRATPSLAERLAGAEPCWPRPLSIFGIPYGFVYRAPANPSPGLYRLGDQMAVIPSLSGYGMSIALHTASLAAENYLHKNVESYYRDAQRNLAPLIQRTSFLGQMISYPIAQKAVFLACNFKPSLMTFFAGHNRISQP